MKTGTAWTGPLPRTSHESYLYIEPQLTTFTHPILTMSPVEEWLTWSFSPSISAILVTLLISLTLPVAIHYYLYKKAVARELPTFLLLGPSGAGKTALLTLV